MIMTYRLISVISVVVPIAASIFDPLHHLGGNSPYFQGPNVFGISPTAPEGCSVDQVAFVSRHGSRYPDSGAYQQWVDLSTRIHSAKFTSLSPKLDFIRTWKPVLRNPSAEIAQLSVGGHQELYDMGVRYRLNYPRLLVENSPFILWANRYQGTTSRVTDSARVFAQGYLGVNASSTGKIYVLNQTDPRSLANSLAPSDLCPGYKDLSGGESAIKWANSYLPGIVDRINSRLIGISFNSTDVVSFPYLCGFETQITGRRSPWCEVFTARELSLYEYAQDLRYYYAFQNSSTAPGKGTMLPFLDAVIRRFVDGPNATYVSMNTSAPDFSPNPLIATFSNDGQINQLAAAIGVFDSQTPLPADRVPADRIFRSSTFATMKGTISFERLNCRQRGLFMRIKLNDAVYPVSSCQDGPGRSCMLNRYQAFIDERRATFGDFGRMCGIVSSLTETTFLHDLGLPFEYIIKP